MWTLTPISNFTQIKDNCDWAHRLLRDQRIVKDYHLLSRHYDEPFLFSYGATINIASSEGLDRAGGVSFDQSVALMKSAGEAAERFSVIRAAGDNLEPGSFADRSPELPVDQFRFFSPQQISTRPFEVFNWPDDAPFTWTEGRNLLSGKELLLPAQLVYLTEEPLRKEPSIMPATTTGVACGWTAEESSLSAILEILERDAFMVHYLSRTEGIRIELRDHPLFCEIEEYLRRFRLKLQVFLLQTDFPVCPVLALITEDFQDSSPSPWMAAGLKCAIDPSRAILGAIEEACQTRLYTRNLLLDLFRSGGVVTPEMASDIVADRAYFWNMRERVTDISFLTQSRRIVPFSEIFIGDQCDARSSLDRLLAYCRKAGHPVYQADVTAPEVQEHGLVVSRIIMPTLQQFYLTEPYIPLACSRWRDVPHALGLCERRQEPNPIPHFFL